FSSSLAVESIDLTSFISVLLFVHVQVTSTLSLIRSFAFSSPRVRARLCARSCRPVLDRGRGESPNGRGIRAQHAGGRALPEAVAGGRANGPGERRGCHRQSRRG